MISRQYSLPDATIFQHMLQLTSSPFKQLQLPADSMPFAEFESRLQALRSVMGPFPGEVTYDNANVEAESVAELNALYQHSLNLQATGKMQFRANPFLIQSHIYCSVPCAFAWFLESDSPPPEEIYLVNLNDSFADEGVRSWLKGRCELLEQCVNLQAIYFGGNDQIRLPFQLTNLTNLRYLALTGNRLSQLNLDNAVDSLEAVKLADNHFTEFPRELESAKHLRWVDMSRNRMDDSSVWRACEKSPELHVLIDEDRLIRTVDGRVVEEAFQRKVWMAIDPAAMAISLASMNKEEEVARKILLARRAIKKACESKEDPYHDDVHAFLACYLNEVDNTYWQKQLGTSKPTPSQIVDILDFESDDGYEGYYFILPEDPLLLSILVDFDDDGDVSDISWT